MPSREEYDGTEPLPDSDLVQSDNTETTEAEFTTGQQPIRRRWSHSDDFSVAVLTDPATDGKGAPAYRTYDLGALDAVAKAHLAYAGLTVLLGRAEDPDAVFSRIKSGEIRTRKERAAKVDPWRRAVALALVDATKKAPEPMTEDAAMASAMGMARSDINALKTDPAVIKHWRKLTGATVTIAAVLAERSAEQPT